MEAPAPDTNATPAVTVETQAHDASVEERKPDVESLSAAGPPTESTSAATVAKAPSPAGASVAENDAVRPGDESSKSIADSATRKEER